MFTPAVTFELLKKYKFAYHEICAMSSVDCSSHVSSLVVNSESATYNSSGTFSCEMGQTLFYSNGTPPTLLQTVCLATAQWSGLDGLECWKGWFLICSDRTVDSLTIFSQIFFVDRCYFTIVIAASDSFITFRLLSSYFTPGCKLYISGL